MFYNVSDWFKPVAPFKVFRGCSVWYYYECCGVRVTVESIAGTGRAWYHVAGAGCVAFWDLAACQCWYMSQGLTASEAFRKSAIFFNTL